MTRTAKGWMQLALAVGALMAAVFLAAPALERIPAVGEIHRHVHERGIDADALFYTDVEEFADAETYVRDALEYAPSPGR
ncbi:MAG: hypothetical protein ACYTAF_08735 [Planctomycetota bacterium]